MPATAAPYLANTSVGWFGQKQEIIASTPYRRFEVLNREDYHVADGFYQTPKNQSIHPISELSRNEQFKKILNYRSALPELKEAQYVVALRVFSEMNILLGDLQAKNVVFERTPEDSLLTKATLLIEHQLPYQLFLAVYFDETEPNGYEAILNIFQEKQQLMAASGEFEDLKKRIASFLSTIPTL